jgi:hypothetical protein
VLSAAGLRRVAVAAAATMSLAGTPPAPAGRNGQRQFPG